MISIKIVGCYFERRNLKQWTNLSCSRLLWKTRLEKQSKHLRMIMVVNLCHNHSYNFVKTMAYKRNLLWQGPHNIMEFWSRRIEC
jgi:hypothetical protein